ncbi:MAG: trypsin-like peptidase domain-containing protein [Nanoarchaeota archaeon]
MRLRHRLLLERIIVISLLVVFAVILFTRTSNNYDADFSQEYVEIAKNVIPAVVSITSIKYEETASYGSGVVISEDGYILTNNHVIAGANKTQVILQNKEIYSASLIGTDPPTDIALLKINATQIKKAKLGDSDSIKVGEKVVAIGNPFGLESTITSGIISAKHRDRGPTEYKDFIQTDASINPGNSGGPLVNLDGEVIGINTFIYTSFADETNPEKTLVSRGLGFAIPINLVKNVTESLINNREIIRSYLGVRVTNVIDFNETLGYGKIANGAKVIEVSKDSPAEKAGMKKDDIIKEVNDEEIESSNQLKNMIAWIPVGSEVEITLIRETENNLEEVKVKTVLEERPENY